MERRTLAPTPSDCSMARKTWRMARGVDMLGGLVGSEERRWRVRKNRSEAWLTAACGVREMDGEIDATREEIRGDL